MCFVQSQYKGNHKGGRPSAAPPLSRRPKAASFVLALNKAQALALNTAHVLRLNKADDLALNKGHVLRLNNKICPVSRANTEEAAFGRLHKRGRPSAALLCGFLCVGSERWAYLIVETQDMCLGESQDIRHVETQDMCCAES